MCATFPPSQCSQLKIGRFLELGAGRKRAPIGCKKHTIVVIDPKIAWGFRSADHPPISMKISVDAAIVRSQVSTMQPRCHANHWSLPHNWLPTQVCLKYLANRIPMEAVPIHAVSMNAACRRKKSLERPAKFATSAKFDGEADAIRPMLW